MFSSLRPLAHVHASVLLLLAATATQRSVVYAQSQGDNAYPYYYWLSPGRIVGIAIGALALVLLVLSMLILACRRRRHVKASSKVMVSNYPAGGGQPPQPYPSWQHTQQPSYGPQATEPGWYYPAPGTARSDQAKTATPPGEAQRTASSEQMPRTAPFGEGQRVPPSDQVQRPAPTSQTQRTAPSGQPQTIASPGQAQRVAPSGQVQSTAPPSQAQRTTPSGQAQSTTPPGQAQRTAPSGQARSTTPSVRAQEQGAPPIPPRYAGTKGTQGAGVTNGRDQNPPPYTPTGPPTPPAAHVAR